MTTSRRGSSAVFFFFACSRAHRPLHSFPTRRSSDLAVLGRDRAHVVGSFLARVEDALEGRPDRVEEFLVAAGLEKDRKSTRLNSSHTVISYAVFCLKKKKEQGRRLA